MLGNWTAASASVIGQSHVARDKPCQDFATVQTVLDKKGNEILLVAVSDGAGSAKFSEHGSKLVCETFMSLAKLQLSRAPNEMWTKDFFRTWHQYCLECFDAEAKKREVERSDLAATALFELCPKVGDGCHQAAI